ncbi:MAG TPA: methyltransferase domain-containing protein [Ignavibacteriaceae bacterium]|nr:methyltransferase domain-containing protein [Ignavibacteriaceae bacterium]
MKLEEAVRLIYNEFIFIPQKQVWADLGCGSGTFTKALAVILTGNSVIYAVDKIKSVLNNIPDRFRNSTIEKINGDFTRIELPFNLNGILMANSLHYVEDQDLFIKKIHVNLKEKGYFLIIEYDMNVSTPWIPYPVSFNSLKKLFDEEKYSVIKLADHPSVYRKEKIFSALIMKKFKK